MKTKESKIKAKIPKNRDKKTGFKPKTWAVKLIKEDKILMDG